MRVAFVRNRGVSSALIRLFTWSRYHHCGAVSLDGQFVIESTTKSGVVKTPIKEFIGRYSTVDFATIECDDKKAYEFLNKQIGKKYDYLAIFNLLFRLTRDDINKWICSELLGAASRRFRKGRTSRVTPEILWMISKD